MKRVTVELSDDGKRLWVFPADHDVTDELKPSKCIEIPTAYRREWPDKIALQVGLAVQRALEKGGG